MASAADVGKDEVGGGFLENQLDVSESEQVPTRLVSTVPVRSP